MLRDAKISLLTLVLIVSLVGSAGAQHCPVGDLNEDCKVNFRDLRLLTDRWLDASCVAPACEVDLDGAPGVDMSDFAWLAGSWLEDYSEITLVINEFMAKNNSDSGIRDEWGDYDDWLEIYNYGNEAIDTGGMYLTDDVCKPPILWWQVPDNHPEETTIVTHGFLLIWADGETYEGTLHASFKLSGSGEFPGLYDANGHLIDSKKYGPQGQNESYGRLPDGSNNWQVFDRPTPGWSNDVQPPSILITEIMYHPYHSTSGTIEPEDIREEYIELYNQGTELVSLADWRFSDGVDFVFPSGVTIGAGEYLVVAADVNTFMAKYPVVTNVVGGWDGRLSNSGETIELIDDMGVRIDRVRYADQGEWSVRELGLPGQYDQSHRGWVWSEDTDGEGKSLELVNQALPNEYGQNWKASTVDDGTPGVVNSIADADIAPLIVNVKHSPIIPGPNDPVTVTARIIDELTSGLTVTLHYCVDTSVYQGRDVYPHHDPGDYNHLMMFDDGAHGDGDANDGIHGVNVPAHPDGTIIEFYVEASDTGANSRTWPAPAMMDGTPEQVTNALYLVDDSFDADEYWVPGSQPIYHIIMTEMERGRLQQIVSISSLEGPNCQMNTTFISADGVDIKVRYNVGVRNRGHTRWHWPNNYRVNFAHDRPWKGVTAININSVYTYLQLVGNAIFRMSGLAQCETTAVQVRINGQNLALNNDEMYGSYVHLEVIDSDFADNHYPIDDAGNAYKCMRITHQADLRYEGSDPDPYRSNYFKKTNNAADDWSDLIGLTYALSENTPDESYVEEVNRVMNTEQWLRSIAINALMNNRETTLANGNGDDYYLYRGIEDTRFILIQHDLDTVFGMGENPGGPTDSIFEATDIPAMNRFLTHPQFVPRYYWHLKDLIETTFSSEQIGRFLDNMLGDFVPTAKINQIKNFVSARNAHVLSLIPQEFTIDSDLPQNSGYYLSTVSVATLDNINGTANAIETRSVRVNAQPADWWPIYGDVDNGQCKWSVAESTDITLNPGINRVIVQTFDHPNGTGNELERGYIDIWYDDGNDVDIFGTLASNTTLDAASGPWHVTGDVVVPAGKTLTIEPGTTLFFNANTSITVQQGGRLVAEGTRYQRIRLTHVPGGANWDGIKFDHSLEDNRLCFVDHEFGDVQDNRSTDVRYSRVLIDNMTWAGTDKRVLNIDHPTVICRNSVFPSIGNTEPLHGVGLSGNECIIFDGCIFGSAGGYSDIIDFTGGQRPGPIFQLYNSIFLGGGDDGPDLDGTDAHIEGNIFMNFHHEPGSDSTSNAVATGQDGGRISNINVARNIFINNDHAVLLKEDCFMRAQNNVFVNTEIAVISFGEPYRNPPRDPGGGVDMDGNIFWNNAEMFEHFFQEPLPTYGPTGDVIINSSILPSQWHYLGQNNIDADPIFVDPNSDFHLKLMSPAIGTGPWGFDMGAYVPAGAAISGEPDEITYLTDVNITVGGPGITDYKYCINDPNGPWLGEFSVDTPIVLNSLTDGQSYTVYAMGKNSAGVWQSDPCYATSRTWTIDNSYSRLVINEVLAHTHGTDPDLIELYYDGPDPLDLTDMSLTDDPCDPNKFVFSSLTVTDTIMYPRDYMVLYGDLNDLRNHLGFAFSSEGEGLYLYDKPANGGGLIDSIVFGTQINDFSIGRIGYGGVWKLNQPTFGHANVAQPLGGPAKLKINEWLANEEVLFEEDFVELYNPEAMPIDMSALYLTDNPVTQPAKQRLGPLSFVSPNGYAVFIADDTDEPGHLDFRLSADGEIIGLFDAELNEIDKVLYGPQTTDASRGRTNGSDNFEFFELPTPRIANPSGPTVTVTNLIAIDGAWSYEQSNTNLGTAWRAVGYNDSLWPTGAALLYVGGAALPAPKNTPLTLGPPTFYFRRHFTLDVDPNDVTSFEYSTVIDDGAVVYINGNEVLPRIGMEEDVDIYFSTFADRTVSDADYEGPFPPIPADFFVQGDNVIAVEVHQTDATSSDIVFGLELDAVVMTYDESLDDLLALLDGLRITELMYHDPDNSDYDYIELQNVGDVPLDMNGGCFTDGIEYTFPPMTLDVGEYVVVVSHLDSFISRYGTAGINIAGEYTGNLSNGGEKIVLQLPWPYEAAILRFGYNDTWYPTTDGLGFALVIRDVTADPATWDQAESWEAATPTPGASNP